MIVKAIFIGVVCNLLLIFPTMIWGSEVTQELSVLGDEEISQRLRFIKQRLDEGRRNANYWQTGWFGFYATSSSVQGAAAIVADNSDNRAYYAVGATKSAFAMTYLVLHPLAARHGADEIRAMPGESRAERLIQLERGEELLRENAERARRRWSWKPHLISLGLNLAGGAAIWAFGDGGDALISTVSGLAVSEIVIFTQPRRAKKDLEDYENEFSRKHSQKRLNWRLMPVIDSAGVSINLGFSF